MGLLEAEIFELRKLRKEYRQGRVNEKQVQTEISIYSQTEKRAKQILMALIAGQKLKNGLLGQIYGINMMGKGQAIDVGEGTPDEEKVKCPLSEKLIMRAECLDYSGSHYDECKGCEIGRYTKSIMLPED